MRLSFAIILLLLTGFCWADPLSEGQLALNSGDWAKAQEHFSRLSGEQRKLAQAQVLLVLGRDEQVAQELVGESIAVQVTRLQALYGSREYTRGRALLRELEKREHGSFPPPYDFRFYLYRGLLERRGFHHKLAGQNYREALRRARSADQRVRAIDALANLWLSYDDLDKAQKVFADSLKSVGDIESVWVLADHLDTASDIHYQSGEQATAAALNRASRELYLAHNNASKAADMLLQRLYFAELSNDDKASFAIKKAALREYSECNDHAGVLRCLELFASHYYNSTAESDGLDEIYTKAIASLPEGVWRQRAQLVQARNLLELDRPPKQVRGMLEEPLRSLDPRVRCQAHQKLAAQLRSEGHYDAARSEFEKALALATPQMSQDRDWRCAPGSTLISLSNLEKNRHNYSAALTLARRAIDAQPDDDWRFWRVDSRYQSLMAAMETYDLAEARVELEASLLEMEKLRRARERAGRLTTIIAALSLNQSVDDDVLDPAQLLLGEYSEVAESLLGETFSDPDTLNRYLQTFDGWRRSTEKKQQTLLEPYPVLYKGLFLEALGRLAPARKALDSALSLARKNRVKPAQMLSLIMLARVNIREGRGEEAVDALTEAAGIARQVNPVAARFYLLVAGSAQRAAGRLELAKESFDLAIACRPREAWAGLYGRALTWQKLGQPEQALADIEKALVLLQGRQLPASLSLLQARRAHILDSLGKAPQARPLFEKAHQELLQIGAATELPGVTLDYAKCLVELQRSDEALKLLTDTIDKLSDWHALSFPRVRPLFERTIELALAQGREKEALRYLQMSHSAELLESVQLSEVKTGDPATEKLLSEVRQLKLRLGRLREQSGGAQNQAARDSFGQMLAATREQFFSKMNELKSKEPDFEALVQLSGSQLSAVQKLLSPQSALVEYFPSKDRLYIFVVTRREFSLHQVSITRLELAKMVDHFLKQTSQPGQKSGSPLAHQLYQILIQSTGQSLEGYQFLRVVPSGPLWEVPFNVLADSQGRTLNQRFEISYLSSSDLMKVTKDRPASHPREALLVSGAADLDGAKSEIGELSRMLPEAKVLKGEQLSLFTFGREVESRDVIHIASHSHVGPQSYIELGKERLDLEQIYGLELKPGSLVVLSSCRSGVAKGVPGKELTSLANGFSIAGASTVVASRWEVDDQSTSEFFRLFYEAALKGKTRGEALRYAELETAKKRPHPYFWAGFSLLGDPR